MAIKPINKDAKPTAKEASRPVMAAPRPEARPPERADALDAPTFLHPDAQALHRFAALTPKLAHVLAPLKDPQAARPHRAVKRALATFLEDDGQAMASSAVAFDPAAAKEQK